MTSNPSFSRFGVEAMSSYFMTNSSMISADAPSFHPNMPPDGSVSFADPVIGGAADIGTHFMANNMMLTSLASQLFCTNPLQGNLNIRTSSQNMNDAYVASDSCSTAHPLLQFSPSDGMIVQPSKKVPKLNGDPQCDWGYIGSSTMSVHDSYNYDTGFSDAAFAYPFSAGSAVTSELSLSLCSKSSSISMVNAPDQSSEVSCSALTHVNSKDISFRQPPYNDVGVDAELVPMYPQMCSRPMHFSDVLARSRYTHIAQQVLNDVVGHVLQGVADIANPVSGTESEARPSLGSRCSMMAASTVSSNQLMASCEEHPRDGADAQKLRNELLNMLHLMDQRYNQCLDEVQSTAAKYSHLMQPSSCAPFAHHAVSAAYRSLRKRVTGAITLAAWGPGRGEASASEKDRTSWESSFIQKHWALQQLRRGDQQSWRPQRGLPEKSVAVLKSWMLENFLRPYPKDNEKEMLAARSGLSRSQVSNWFINARVRLWKPMIEEMYEELKKNSGSGGGEGLAAVERRSCEDAAIS